MSKGVVDGLGAFMFICGLGGMADAVTGQGTFMVAAVIFAIGFGLTLRGYFMKKGEKLTYEHRRDQTGDGKETRIRTDRD